MAKKEIYLVPRQELDALQEKLLEVLEQNQIPAEMLKLSENKGTMTLFLRSDLICRLAAKGEGFSSIAVGKQFAAFLPRQAGEGKAQGEMLRFEFEPEMSLAQWAETLCKICECRIDGIPKAFDCCHRYAECSETGYCTNPDRLYAMECGYKKMLKKGIVFYGSRRNAGEQP